MAGTFLNFPFEEELFNDMWREAEDPVKTAILQGGAMVNDASIASMIGTKGDSYTIPFYNLLGDTDPDNFDGQTDINTEETSGDAQTGIVYGRAKGFTARDFTAIMTGADPMGYIARNVGMYWNHYEQKTMLAILNAIFGITGGASTNAGKFAANHIINLAATTSGGAAYTIGATDLNDLAVQALGDSANKFALAIMHSNVAKTLANLQLLEFRKYTDDNGITRQLNVADCNGYTVVVDDSVPVEKNSTTNLNEYTTYLLGAGSILRADGALETGTKASEVHRDPKTNGGQDTLYTRIRQTIHPNGFSFIKPNSGYTGSPTLTQLGDKANWSLKFDQKVIPFAKMVTNG